ncbi:autotransporter domain-containing protein [Bosea vestrisii]|uniref:autotransporter outer membrane beta-barrel domain-containing protein n=1 Tax=Bosea vestrisii TaxID=151416 RepID=UPI0024E01F01|nr:autotransporter domain-containing protein [Bosea vestrisii]WID97511.1 autotransporter domain-containing protein [Bosea vestrisii]
MRAGSKGFAAGQFLRTVSFAALVLGLAHSAASAATYLVSNETDLRNAIAAANASPDASSTIVLTQSFTVTTAPNLATPTKSLTIDTQGFVLSGAGASSNTFNGNFPSGSLIILGTLIGGTGGVGLVVNSGITTVGASTGQVVNNGSISGGAAASGGLGVSLLNVVTFVNNGTVSGGTGTGGGITNNGAGVNISNSGATLINNASGVIQGSNSLAAGHTGAGVFVTTTGKAATITNYGTIRGGSDLSGAGTGNVAIRGRGAGANPLTINNLGTGVLEGGNAAAAITNDGNFPWTVSLTNSGTIRAGNGSATAVRMANNIANNLTLELQAGSQIMGNVVASAAGTRDVLRLGGADNWTLDGGIGSASQYQNFDSLEKTGASAWTLTGSGDFAGATTISAGALIVNGSLAGSAVTVASGARLGGSGTVGALTVASGGRISPGNSIGTLTVNGAYVQNAGAVYEVEIDPGTVTSDRIDVKGTATLANGAMISAINYTGAAFVAGQRYTILTSTGLTGDYGSTDLVLSPFLSLRNVTDATNAYLSVVQTATAGGIGGTGNEQEVGKAVDSLPTGNAVQTDVYNQATLEAARRALGQLAGEIHASARTVLIDESWLLRQAANDRLRSAFGAVGASPMATLNYGFTADLAPAVKGPMPKPPSAERFAVWGQGYGSWGRTASDGNAASLSRSTGGLLVGADVAAFETMRFGVVAGYSRSTFSVNGRLSSGESDNYHLGLYGGGQWGALNLRTGLSYTWHDLSTRRGIVAAGLGDTLRADYDAGTAQAFGELGYRIDLGQTAVGQVALEPFAGLAYVVLRSDGFAERGGAAALSSGSDDTSLGYATLGLRAATTTRLAGLDLTLRGGLGWRHAFGDVDPKTTLAFSGSAPFAIAGLPIARNAALVEAGLDVALGANVTLGASYTAQLAEDSQDHAFKANLAVRF